MNRFPLRPCARLLGLSLLLTVLTAPGCSNAPDQAGPPTGHVSEATTSSPPVPVKPAKPATPPPTAGNSTPGQPMEVAAVAPPPAASPAPAQDASAASQSLQAEPTRPAPMSVLKQVESKPETSVGTARGRLVENESMRRYTTQDIAVYVAPEANRENYGKITEQAVKLVSEAPVSTFSIDVDTGSYSNVRRLLNAGQLPPPDAVRVEELINYFPYEYAQPKNNTPFAVHTTLAPAPWNSNNLLLRVALKGKDIAKQSLPPANLVFLVDTSGSMYSPDKLPLLQSSLKMLVQQLRAQDRVTLVTYAGDTRIALPPTAGSDKTRIINAIDRLQAGGSTAGASGIQLAYQAAQQSFITGGINRILLATDGDFNVGVTNFEQLKAMAAEKRKSGVSLSTLGFGTGNYNEHLMEQLADAGNGAYSYIDTLMEGHKVLVNEMTSTLATIAKDVKIQIEFNPGSVKEYRLIGYENRLLNREDFNNDKVDAGDIGAGHTVTALYELTLTDRQGLIDPLRYQKQTIAADNQELAHLKLRYKQPDGDTSTLIEKSIERNAITSVSNTDTDFRFAVAVAGFGQILRGGKYTATWQYKDARQLASGALGSDAYGYRGEFLRLVDLAQALGTPQRTPADSDSRPDKAS